MPPEQRSPSRKALTKCGKLTKDILKRHFHGESQGDLIGLHAISESNTCLWIAIDIDLHGQRNKRQHQKNRADAITLYWQLVKLAFKPLLISSNGRGGYHLWILFNDPVPSRTAYLFARWLIRDWADLGLSEEPETFPKQGRKLRAVRVLALVVAGRSMAWKNILDMRRAIDYLVTRPEVKSDALGCYGHSMGSTHAWLVGPWEPRLKCIVGNCCLPTYAAIHRAKLLHCFPNFIPGLHQYGDTPDIAGLIAPRALHLNFGEKDDGSPIEEVRQGIETIAAAYKAAGAMDRFTWFIENNTGHVLSEAMWQRVRDVFAKYLGGT